MSQIVVIGFDAEGDAFAALKTLRSIEKEGGIKFEDTAVVSHRADGKMEVKNEASSATEVGAVVGGALGGLVFFMFPVAGIALGAAAGAGVGAMLGTGVDGKFRDEVKAQAAARQVRAVPGDQGGERRDGNPRAAPVSTARSSRPRWTRRRSSHSGTRSPTDPGRVGSCGSDLRSRAAPSSHRLDRQATAIGRSIAVSGRNRRSTSTLIT